MATLIDNPSGEWNANEVYEIQVGDPCQGAGQNSLFGGLGIHNQPHQQLANRTAYLNNQVNGILATLAKLTCSLSGNPSYFEVPMTDTVLGGLNVIVQFGQISVIGFTASQLKNATVTQAFAVPFTTACKFQNAFWLSNAVGNPGAFANCMATLECITPFALSEITIESDWDNGGYPGGGGTINIASSPTDGNGLTAIGWIAIGY